MSVNNGAVVAQINEYPEEKYNRLFPSTLTELSPLHKVMVNIVAINPNPAAGDVYEQKKSKGLSLTKIGCLKLMTAANVVMQDSRSVFPAVCQRCMEVARNTRLAPQCASCGSRDDIAYQATILVPEPSGGHRQYIATKEIKRDEYVKSGAPSEHMAAQCESKALLRALRNGLGLKGSYTAEELRKPFAVALVVLNAHDPELKRAMIERYTRGADLLFGAPPTAAPSLAGPAAMQAIGPAQYADDDDDEIPPVPAGTSQGDHDAPSDLPGEDDDPPEELIICQGCDEIIEGSGSWTPERIADYSRRTYGKVLCLKCQKAAKAGGHK